MSAIDKFLTVARAYAEAEGITLATASSRIFDDGKRIAGLESGRDLTSRRLEQAMAWLSDRWPEEALWPADVPRPEPSSTTEQAAA